MENAEKDQKCLVRVEKIFPKIKEERPAAAFTESDSTDSEDDEIVNAVGSALKYSFVQKYLQTRRKGRYKEFTLSPRLHLKLLVTAIISNYSPKAK